MNNEIDSYSAREKANQYGVVIGVGEPRQDGGWDFLVETDNGDAVCCVVRDDDGSICSMLA